MSFWERIIAVVLFCGLAGITAHAAGEEDHLWLHTDGKYIKNTRNERFMGVGTNVMYGGWAKYPNCDPKEITTHLKQLGINAIRLFCVYTDNSFTPDYDKLEEFVAACRHAKIYVFITFQVQKFPVQNGSTFRAAWAEMATRFKDEPWLMAYEIWNEPHRDLSEQQVRDAVIPCVETIRAIDSKHIIMVPCQGWTHSSNLEDTWGAFLDNGNSVDVLDPPQIVYTFHSYPRVGWESTPAEVINGNLGAAENFQDAHNVPVYHTETGCIPGEWDRDFNEAGYRAGIAGYLERQAPRSIGWSLLSYKGQQFPDGPAWNVYPQDIWIPAAKRDGTPIVDNGTASQLLLHLEPHHGGPWDTPAPGMIADGSYETEVTARICDSDSLLVSASDNTVSFSVSGPASILGSSQITAENGVAKARLRSLGSAGEVTVTATASGLGSGSLSFTAAPMWSDFEIKQSGGSWTAADAVPAELVDCRIKVQNLASGLNVGTARIEYSLDKGNTWISHDNALSDEFNGSSLNDSWTSQSNGLTGGSVTLSNGKLAVQGKGRTWRNYMNSPGGQDDGYDEFHVVCKRVPGEWEVTTKVTSQTNTSSWAKAGIWMRNELTTKQDNAPAVLAVTPDNGVVLEWSTMGRKHHQEGHICDRIQADIAVTFPIYLKMVKVRRYITGYYSRDGVSWTQVGSRSAIIREEYEADRMDSLLVGLFANSGNSSSNSTAEFDFFHVNYPATCTRTEDAAHTVPFHYPDKDFTRKIETITATGIPFDNGSPENNRIRFVIRDSFKPWTASPGNAFVSPTYPGGEVAMVHRDRMHYPVGSGKKTLRVYTVSGRLVRTVTVDLKNGGVTPSLAASQLSGIPQGVYVFCWAPGTGVRQRGAFSKKMLWQKH